MPALMSRFACQGGDIIERVGNRWMALSPAEAQRMVLELQTAIRERQSWVRCQDAGSARPGFEAAVALIEREGT